jgi:hypothetical protein
MMTFKEWWATNGRGLHPGYEAVTQDAWNVSRKGEQKRILKLISSWYKCDCAPFYKYYNIHSKDCLWIKTRELISIIAHTGEGC